jgi:hypothetical protein
MSDTPQLASLILASNIAWDPYRRLSGHGLFTVATTTVLPFAFPQMFYAIGTILNISHGEHSFGLGALPGELEFESEPRVDQIARGVALVTLGIGNCQALRGGQFYLEVLVDGASIGKAFGFTLIHEPTGEPI